MEQQKTSFELTIDALRSNDLYTLGAARLSKANANTIISYCMNNNIDLLKPKDSDLPYLVELLMYLVSEGNQCQNALESFSQTKH